MKSFLLTQAQLRAAQAEVPSPYANPYSALTSDLLHHLLQFSRDPSSPGCLLLQGLPIDEALGERHRVQFRPGDALLISNRKGLHARASFQPRCDGPDRWLLRANIHTSL